MRIEKTMKNIVYNIANTFMVTILKFISRTIFIKTLGITYLGINGLLLNVLSLLSIAELGIGAAISFSLYKPLAEKNKKLIDALMSFYRKAYMYIGYIILIVGLILMFFLEYIIKDSGNISNLKLIYFIYLMATVIPYYFSYKETLIIADQNGYKLVPINFIFTIATTTFQIIVLLLYKNYILYLLVQLIITFIQRIFINYYINKKYDAINFKSKEKIPTDELKTIKKNIKALIIHKIADYSIYSTDNIIISSFISVTVVGMYSNYGMIIGMVNMFVILIFNGATSSFGNLIVEGNKTKQTDIFKKFDFLGFWIYGFTSICLLLLLNDFITLWIGKEYLLGSSIVIVLCLNNYLVGMRTTFNVVKSAAGLYDKDKHITIIHSIANLIISIILVQYIGLLGVFLGTILSGLISQIFKPFIIYRELFNEKITSYFKRQFKYIISLITTLYITYIATENIVLENIYFNFLLKTLICIILPNIILYIMHHKTDEFKYYKELIKSIMKGGVQHRKT
ncbi:MAG: oligosaccharide flippase family protein [Bacilli bacterium]|nr:oligosaccharide flippase family protein [Bacilli bacterium]